MAVTFFNWIKTTLANITAANIADADEFVVIDQDGDGASPPGPASRAITRSEASKALVVQEELAESPISPDNTVSEYVFDVRDYVEVVIQWDALGYASADVHNLRFSTDDGATYKSGAADYKDLNMSPAADNAAEASEIPLHAGSTGTTDFTGFSRVTNLRAGRAVWQGFVCEVDACFIRNGYAFFDGPITHIKIFTSSANNFNAGTIRAVGIRGSAP